MRSLKPGQLVTVPASSSMKITRLSETLQFVSYRAVESAGTFARSSLASLVNSSDAACSKPLARSSVRAMDKTA